MDDVAGAFEAAVWAAAEGVASESELATLEAEPREHQRVLERVLAQAEERLDAANDVRGAERSQVLADAEAELSLLEAAYSALTGGPPPDTDTETETERPEAPRPPEPPEEVRLQASWLAGQVVVWAAGRGTAGESIDELADRLEAIGGPPLGWSQYPAVKLPNGSKADALSIPVRESLGWLVAVGGGLGREGVGPSVAWLGHVAVAGVRLVAHGGLVPTLRSDARAEGRARDLRVRWLPAAADEADVDALARAMPGPITLLAPGDARGVTRAVMTEVVHAIAVEAAEKLELPAPPPTTRTVAAVAEAVVTRLDGSVFVAPLGPSAEVSKALEAWAKPVTTLSRRRLVVQLDPPDKGNAWFLSVFGPGADGLQPIEIAIAESEAPKSLAGDLARLERMVPALLRPGAMRRGQVYLSQDEAWELMTVTGPMLDAAGFEVRVPALSRRRPSPALRLFAEAKAGTVVGANQLSNVRWSAVFDDVELSAADVARLAAEARPLVQSRGRWVALDRVDLKEAAAALAERAATTRLSGAEILRHAVGLEGTSGLRGGLVVDGSGWATDLLDKAKAVSTDPVPRPENFVGELRSYQAESLGWLAFLEAVGLGGCLALDMGLGKTPTVLAHLASAKRQGPSLVIAPAAVVGNWDAEAKRFTPSLRVVVHHGASRASADELEAEVAGADLLITTYGTAVRDIDALAARTWDCVVLDEAQAIKNAATETAQQLRVIPARTRLALTGTPIENGLGDLWAILDYTNPGLVGSRPSFVAQLAGEGEAALRALNGILVFRRTKAEPEVAAELPDRIDELDHCTMTREQIGLYQAVLDRLVGPAAHEEPKKGAILAAITALKQICNHPAAYQDDGRPLAGRSGKLDRLDELVAAVFAADESVLVFTHFAEWGKRLADHLTATTGVPISCYHGGLARGVRDRLVAEFQAGEGPGALVLSLKAGGTGLNLTAASHVVLYDRWWNPAVEDQARDRAWRIGQTRTVVSHRLVCPGTIDERVEEVVAGKRHIADLVLPKSSSLAALDADQLRVALGLRPESLLAADDV
ncbi:MAG TPA: DEAD/DEAH box helicase [Acidimicrobiales bacterium]|nr:DEAD/DEAH box helicase [Acidimicrobiales bacterium]